MTSSSMFGKSTWSNNVPFAVGKVVSAAVPVTVGVPVGLQVGDVVGTGVVGAVGAGVTGRDGALLVDGLVVGAKVGLRDGLVVGEREGKKDDEGAIDVATIRGRFCLATTCSDVSTNNANNTEKAPPSRRTGKQTDNLAILFLS